LYIAYTHSLVLLLIPGFISAILFKTVISMTLVKACPNPSMETFHYTEKRRHPHMIHDNSIVPRDATPDIVWPDKIQDPKEQRPMWFVPVVATVILGMIVAIGVTMGLQPATGGRTDSPNETNFVPKINDLFDSCSVEDVLFECLSKIPGLEVTVPSCMQPLITNTKVIGC
jgi:hypothetical protein